MLFDQLLREDVTQADDLLMEQIILAVGILSKVILWGAYSFLIFFLIEGFLLIFYNCISKQVPRNTTSELN